MPSIDLGHVDVGRVDVELFLDQLPDRLRHRARGPPAGQPRGSLTLPEDRLDRGEQVVGFVDLQVEIEVARHPERVHRHDLHPREQHVEVGGDHLFLRDEPFAVGQREQARMFGGTFTRANRRTCVDGSRATTARFSDRSEMYGNGCAGSTDNGVRIGNTALLERLPEMDAVVAAKSSQSTTLMPAAASRGRTLFAQI
jgi:hypothetical protein